MLIMAGHIALPEYSYKLVPGTKYEDVLPATLAPELINGPLKTQLDSRADHLVAATFVRAAVCAMPEARET